MTIDENYTRKERLEIKAKDRWKIDKNSSKQKQKNDNVILT